MQNTNRNLAFVFALALVVGATAFLLYRSSTTPLTTQTNQVATTTQTSTASTTTSTNTVGQDINFITEVQAAVIKARAQKNAGDYKGAIATLVAAKATLPGDVVINNNLGDLYMNFAKDYVKAEASYKTIIATDPHYLDAYRHLLELYTTTSYKPSNTAAADIVAKALVALPKAYDLQVILARWYRDTHDYPRAVLTYKAAIANAKGQGLTKVVTDLEAELARIPQ